MYGKIFEGKTQDNVFKLMGNTHTYTHTQSYTLIIYNITYQLPVPSANSSVKKYYNVYIYIFKVKEGIKTFFFQTGNHFRSREFMGYCKALSMA